MTLLTGTLTDMKRELKEHQLIERTIIKKYRKELWNPFIQGVKNYSLVNDGDVILIELENTAESMLLAKLLQQLKRVSSTDFELIFTGGEKCSKNAERLNIPLSENEAGANKLALSDTLSDICEELLSGLFYGGEIKAPLPAEKGETTAIRPMYCISRSAVEKWASFNNLIFNKTENERKTAEILADLKKTNPEIENNILNSLSALCLDTMVGYTLNGEHKSFLENYSDGDKK